MSVITFRASIPTATLASAPVQIELNSMARAIQEIAIWSPTSIIDKSGFRLKDRGSSKVFIPAQGSNDNSVMAAAGESGWAPLLTIPLVLDMNEQIIEGPPYKLQLEFFNTDATVIKVAGFIIVREPFTRLDDLGGLYEFAADVVPNQAVNQNTNQGTKMEVGK